MQYFKIGEEIGTVPDENVQAFLAKHQTAQKCEKYKIGDEIGYISKSQSQKFLEKYPQAINLSQPQGQVELPAEMFTPNILMQMPESQIPTTTVVPESTQQPMGEFRDPLQHASILPPASTDGDERGAYKARGFYNVADIAANVDRFYDKYIVSPIGDMVTKGLPEDTSKKSYERLEEWSNEMRSRLPQPSGKYAAPPEEWSGYLDPKRLEMTFFESAPQVGVFAAATLANPIFGYAVMVGAEGGETIKTMENWEKETGEKVPEVYKTIAPIIVGSVNGLLERYGINKILKGFKVPTNLAQRAVNAITAMSVESGTEGFQSSIQSMAKSGYAKAAEELMDIVLNAGEQLIEDKDQIIAEAYAGLVSGGGMATATQAVGAVGDISKKPGTERGIEDRLLETITEDEKQELKDAGIELKISKVPIKETTTKKEIKAEQKIREEIKKEVVPHPPKLEKPKEIEGWDLTEEEKKKLELEREKPLEESIEDLRAMGVLGEVEINGEKVTIKPDVKHAEEIREDIEKVGKKEVFEERETAEQVRLRNIEKDRLEAEKVKIPELKEEIKEKKVEIPKYDEKSETNDALIFGLENIGNKELIPKLEAAREDVINKMEKETDIEKKIQLSTQAQLYRESKEIIEEKGGSHEFVESQKLTLEGLKEGKTKRVITEKADIAKQQIIKTSESKEKGEVNLKIAETLVKRIAKNTGRTENEVFAELTTKRSKVEDVKGKKLFQKKQNLSEEFSPQKDYGESFIPALELEDGRIFLDKKARIHSDVFSSILEKYGITADQIKDGGFVFKGQYNEGSADTKRISEPAKARKRLKLKKILFQQEKQLKQQTKGAIEFKDSETVIHIFENADASTILHELFHFGRNKGVLNKYDEHKLLNWTGEKTWNMTAEEKTARAFEKYLREGKSPTTELADIFKKIKKWMREVYEVIQGSPIDIKLTNEVKDIFDSMLGGEKTRLKETKVKKGRVPKTIRQWVQDRGRVMREHLAEHGVSPKEDKGLFLQLAAKKGTGMPLDDLAASAIEERIISKPPSDYNPTDWLIHNLRENKKLEDMKTEAEEIVQAEMEHYYEEARNEGAIPAEMSFEQFEDANQVEFSDDIKEIEVDVLFQQQNIYEKEYIKAQALKGVNATKKTGFKSLAEREEYYKKAKEIEGKAGTKDLFRTVKQTTLFQEEVKPDDIADKRINREKLTYLINKKITELKVEGEGKLGSKGKTKKQLYLKYLIVQYAKQNLPPDLIKRHQTVMLMTAVKNAKTPVTVKKAFDKIDAVAREIQTRVVKANVNKLLVKSKVKKVRGKISGKYTAEAQEKLDEIRSSVKITVADAELLSEKLGDYIENKPDVIDDTENIQKLKEQLFYADFKNATLDKAERVYLEVKNLVDTGRTLRQEKEDARKERMKIIRDAVYDVLTGGKEIKSTTQLLSKVKFKLAENVKSGFLSMVGWDALIEDLSKFETAAQFKGKLFDLSNVVHDARETEQKGLREGHKKIQDILIDIYGSGKKALKARNKDSTEKVNLGTFTDVAGKKIELTLTPNQIYKKWMEMQDPTLAHLFDTMAYTDEMLDAVNKHMNNHTELKRWATWQLREFYPEYYKGVNEVFSERYGVYLPFNVNYSPISVEHPKTQGMEASELLEAQKATSTLVSGSLKKRIYHSRALKYMDGDAVLAMHISKMEHFKAYVNPLRDIQSVFYSPKITQAIEQFHSQKANRVIRGFIENLTRGDVDKLLVYKGWDKVRSHFTTSKIAANPTIFLKQLTSLPAFLTEINEIELSTGIYSFLSNPIHATKVLFESEFLKDRYSEGFERDVVLSLKGGVGSKLTGAHNKLNLIKRILAMPVRLGDMTPILMGGWAVYRKSFKENRKTMSETEAKQAALKEFTRVTKRTQQAKDVEDLSEIQRSGTVGKMLTMFMTAVNQYFRLEALAMGRLYRRVRGISQRGSTVQDLRTIAITHFVLPAVFQYVASGMPGMFGDWEDEDTENQLFAMLLGSFNGILIAGNIAESLIQRFRQKPFATQLSPVESIMKRIDRIVTKIGSDKEIKNTNKFIWDFVHSFNEVLTGLPTEPLKRLGDGYYDYFKEKETDPRLLMGYSKYALGIKDKKKGIRPIKKLRKLKPMN